jgi:hypothetical protein
MNTENKEIFYKIKNTLKNKGKEETITQLEEYCFRFDVDMYELGTDIIGINDFFIFRGDMYNFFNFDDFLHKFNKVNKVVNNNDINDTYLLSTVIVFLVKNIENERYIFNKNKGE